MKLSAPEIFAEDAANGFLLLEDLGDDTFARVLAAGGDEAELYARATDVLVAVHAAPDHGLLPGLGGYEGEALIEAAMLIAEWYLPEASGRATTAEQTEDYRAAWRSCLAALPPSAGTLLLRDYHKDNLLWLPQRPGVRACGLLDFQDAQRGHPSYDLVSLIEDARRDVAPAVHAACTRALSRRHRPRRQGFPHRLRADGGAAPCPHHRPVRPPAAARRQARISAAPAARLADVRAVARSIPRWSRCASGSTGTCRRRCGASERHDPHRDDPGGRPRRAHAAADRYRRPSR